MANTVNINDLDTLSPSAVDSNYYSVLFTSDGDTNKVVFEDAVSQALANTLCSCIQYASLTIPTADVLTLSATPLTIVPAQGAGTVIELISGTVNVDFNTTAYGGGTTLRFITNGANQSQANCPVLDSTVSTIRKFEINSPSATTATQMLENAELLIDAVAPPTTGDSDIKVYVTYRVITL
jgi:hypothetical protein